MVVGSDPCSLAQLSSTTEAGALVGPIEFLQPLPLPTTLSQPPPLPGLSTSTVALLMEEPQKLLLSRSIQVLNGSLSHTFPYSLP